MEHSDSEEKRLLDKAIERRKSNILQRMIDRTDVIELLEIFNQNRKVLSKVKGSGAVEK